MGLWECRLIAQALVPLLNPPHFHSYLLLHILVLRVEQLDEDGDGPRLYDYFGVEERPRGNVGQGPGSLKLQTTTQTNN